jgi:hypothetical protein
VGGHSSVPLLLNIAGRDGGLCHSMLDPRQTTNQLEFTSAARGDSINERFPGAAFREAATLNFPDPFRIPRETSI